MQISDDRPTKGHPAHDNKLVQDVMKKRGMHQLDLQQKYSEIQT
jgi:hypothetical protein